MSRILEPSNVTEKILKSFDWDFIVLDKHVNHEGLLNWYTTVSEKLNYLKFNFTTCPQYVTNSINNYFATEEENYQNSYSSSRPLPRDEKSRNSYTLTWPIPRDVPLPPPWAANLEFFTELSNYFDNQGKIIKDFDYSSHQYLEQYLFGEFKNILFDLRKFIFNPRITEHMPGHVLHLHVDGYMARMHIPITADSSKFYWGDQWNREYKFEPGKIYLINSRVIHGTTNFGPNKRANIIADIYENTIMDLINLN
jgi:hypothetical protein